MRQKKFIIGILGFLFILCTENLYASCLQEYQQKIKAYSDQSDSASLAESTMGFSVSFAMIYEAFQGKHKLDAEERAELQEYYKVQSLLLEARRQNELRPQATPLLNKALRQLKDISGSVTKLSMNELASKVRQADQENAFCRDGVLLYFSGVIESLYYSF